MYIPELYNGMKWTSVEDGLPPKQTICLVVADGYPPRLRSFHVNEFAKGSSPVKYWIALHPRSREEKVIETVKPEAVHPDGFEKDVITALNRLFWLITQTRSVCRSSRDVKYFSEQLIKYSPEREEELQKVIEDYNR